MRRESQRTNLLDVGGLNLLGNPGRVSSRLGESNELRFAALGEVDLLLQLLSLGVEIDLALEEERTIEEERERQRTGSRREETRRRGERRKTHSNHQVNGNISSDELGSTSLRNLLDSLADLDGLASLGESREDGSLALEESGERGLSRVDEDCDEGRTRLNDQFRDLSSREMRKDEL